MAKKFDERRPQMSPDRLARRDGERVGLGGPSVVVITGKDKPFRTTLSKSDYEEVRRLGSEYRARSPRSVAD